MHKSYKIYNNLLAFISFDLPLSEIETYSSIRYVEKMNWDEKLATKLEHIHDSYKMVNQESEFIRDLLDQLIQYHFCEKKNGCIGVKYVKHYCFENESTKTENLFHNVIAFIFDAYENFDFNTISNIQYDRFDNVLLMLYGIRLASSKDLYCYGTRFNCLQQFISIIPGFEKYIEYCEKNPFDSQIWLNYGTSFDKIKFYSKEIIKKMESMLE